MDTQEIYEIEEWTLLQWCLNHFNQLMTSSQYISWYMEELSKYEQQKEYYEQGY